MKIIITQWGLDAYLNLKKEHVFTEIYYKDILKPDTIKLKHYPNDPKFSNKKFWSPVTFKTNIFTSGYKMKWHQVGSGRVQLRLPIYLDTQAYLCEAYVKTDPKKEIRMIAKFKTHLQLIQEKRHLKCGELK
jgi:hypothetical protein